MGHALPHGDAYKHAVPLGSSVRPTLGYDQDMITDVRQMWFVTKLQQLKLISKVRNLIDTGLDVLTRKHLTVVGRVRSRFLASFSNFSIYKYFLTLTTIITSFPSQCTE